MSNGWTKGGWTKEGRAKGGRAKKGWPEAPRVICQEPPANPRETIGLNSIEAVF